MMDDSGGEGPSLNKKEKKKRKKNKKEKKRKQQKEDSGQEDSDYIPSYVEEEEEEEEQQEDLSEEEKRKVSRPVKSKSGGSKGKGKKAVRSRKRRKPCNPNSYTGKIHFNHYNSLLYTVSRK